LTFEQTPNKRLSMKYLAIIFLLIIIYFVSVGLFRGVKAETHITKTIYNNHSYLIFKIDGQFGQTFVHDPDCLCGKNK